MLQFLVARNLLDPHMAEGKPWEFDPGAERLAEVRDMAKLKRRAWIQDITTDWQVFTTVRGALQGKRISKDNPAAGVLGFCADYDMKTDLAEVHKWVGQMRQEYQPQFIEKSLSGNIRLVWTLSRPLLVRDSQHAGLIIQCVFEKMKVPSLLPGYDRASARPEQVWTSGGEWHAWRKEPMDWQLAFGFAIDAAKKLPAASAEVPLQVIADEVQRRWPNRWTGDFELDTLGVRFWDPVADSPAGCQVKPDGMLCFTGYAPFMSWGQILGSSWVAEKRALNLGSVAGETWFDGRSYFQIRSGDFRAVSREDLLMAFRNNGISAVKMRGQTASDCDRTLGHVQVANYVDGACPLINYPTGIVYLRGKRLLNTSTLKMFQPSSKLIVTPEDDFPFCWDIHECLLARKDPIALASWLAWLQRIFRSLIMHEPAFGQAVFLCGPKDNGKTLLCLKVAGVLLGDRIANPYKYFTGETDFNSEMFDCPLWALNDEESPNEARKHVMQAKLKAFTVNPEHTYHPKYMAKTTLEWTGRIIVTLNDDAKSTGILPEVNENTADKLMFFGTGEYGKQWPDRLETEARLRKELPFFARWLLDIYEPPKEIMIGGRMGVKSYHDPRILDLSKQQFYSFNLLEMLRMWARLTPEFTGPAHNIWSGTPTELLASITCLVALAGPAHNWKDVAKLAKALTELSRVEGNGIVLIKGSQRTFVLTKETLLKDDNQPSI